MIYPLGFSLTRGTGLQTLSHVPGYRWDRH